MRLFGGVPRVETPITSSDDWRQPRASAEEIYSLILSDLDNAQRRLWKKSEYADEDMGRATRGAALAMLLKVNLYTKNYDAARTWGAELLKMGDNEGEYSLCPNYADNFTLAGENGPESVFEIQYMEDPTSDYGEGYGYTRGTMTTSLTRSRSTIIFSTTLTGWGFNHPTQDLYDEFEEDDPRRDVTVVGEVVVVDARSKRPGVEGYPARFPNVAVASSATVERVDARWAEYGLGETMASPS